jgi:hypothetical protein
MNHPELDFARYPSAPGYKLGGTSKAAADSMREKAPKLRGLVLQYLAAYSLTADECADMMQKSVLSIRPRFTELFELGQIADTGTTRRNSSGRMATVWRAV